MRRTPLQEVVAGPSAQQDSGAQRTNSPADEEVSPDQKSLLPNCFRLQNLLIDQRSIRFRFLLKSKSLDCAVFNSLDELDQRLDKNWNAAEEGISFVWSSCSGILPSLDNGGPEA